MTQLTISTLEQLLARIKHKHGDLPIVSKDADTEWLYKLEEKHFNVTERGLEIHVDIYYSEVAE